MGGNIFKNTSRLTTARLQELKHLVLPSIQAASNTGENNVPVAVPYAFPQKHDHGDLDVLVGAHQPSSFIQEFTRICGDAYPKPIDVSKNDHTVSFQVAWDANTSHQMDVEFQGPMTDKQMEFSTYWHSYGGLGNLIGTLFRRQGLKLRPLGVSWDLQHKHVHGGPDRGIIRTYYFPYTWGEALALVGLQHGPGLYTDIATLYTAVSTCKTFGKCLFSREGMNRKNWDRDKRRPIYNDFVEFIASKTLVEEPWPVLDVPTLLREHGIEQDVMLLAADRLLSRNLSLRLRIPPPIPEEYTEFSVIKKTITSAIPPLDLLVCSPERLAIRVRQLSPDRAIYR